MSRKGENIYKRKDGRWEGRYMKGRTPSGKILYGYVYAKTYREIKSKLYEARVTNPLQSLINQAGEPEPLIFSTIAEQWLNSKKPKIKEATQNKYYNLLYSYILPVCGSYPLQNITYDFIETYCNNLLSSGGKNGQGLSAKTVMDTLSVIRNILKFARKIGISIPYDGSSISIKNISKEMRILSIIEQKQLCNYLIQESDPYNIGILICLYTGLRIGELCALRWEDISFSDKTLSVRHTLQRIQNHSKLEGKTKIIITTPKSPCSLRTIPLPDELFDILSKYRQSSHGYILTNDEVRFVEPRVMQNKFKRALKESDIRDANFHSLRHTFATRCVELGFDVKSLSEILGHSTVNITMNRYVHPSLEFKKENMKKLSSLLAVT